MTTLQWYRIGAEGIEGHVEEPNQTVVGPLMGIAWMERLPSTVAVITGIS